MAQQHGCSTRRGNWSSKLPRSAGQICPTGPVDGGGDPVDGRVAVKVGVTGHSIDGRLVVSADLASP